VTPPAAGRKPGPSVTLSVTVLAVGLLVAVVSAIFFARPFVQIFTDSPRIVGSQPRVLHLGHGHYAVYEQDLFATRLVPGQVAITAADGQPVASRAAHANETLSQSGRDYTSAVRFDIDESGDYRFTIQQPGLTDVLVARTFGDTFHRALPWLPSMIVGGLTFLGGIAMLIVGILRRRSRPATAYGYPGEVR
jgi:hypothetical protein